MLWSWPLSVGECQGIIGLLLFMQKGENDLICSEKATVAIGPEKST